MDTPDLIDALAADSIRPRWTQSNKGRRFPPDPPPVEDIVRVLAACTPQTPGRCGELAAIRLRALIVTFWRTGLRCSEALALEERDLMPQDLAIVVRHGKGDKRRVVAMDEWGWRELRAWTEPRSDLPDGPVFCVVRGRTAGHLPVSGADVRHQFRQAGRRVGLKRRFHPHALRHACAIELWREGIDVYRIGQQLGHARLDITALYLRSLAPVELLEPIGHRRPPMMLVTSAPPRLTGR